MESRSREFTNKDVNKQNDPATEFLKQKLILWELKETKDVIIEELAKEKAKIGDEL